MKKNKRDKTVIILIVILFLLISISIGYSVLITTLNIRGTSTIDTVSWDIHLSNLNITTGSVTATTKATLTNSTTINYAINLNKPGDFYEFSVDVVNDGVLNAKLSASPILSGISNEQKTYMDYQVSYKDGTQISAGDTLNAGTKKTIKVLVKYKENLSTDQLPTSKQSMNLSYIMNYVQA